VGEPFCIDHVCSSYVCPYEFVSNELIQ